ncbi:MAG: hypothetical protein ACT4O9_14340 [Blastocatellia bacterium]
MSNNLEMFGIDSEEGGPPGFGKINCAVLASLPAFFLILSVLIGKNWLAVFLVGILALLLSIPLTIAGFVKVVHERRNNRPTKFWKIITFVAAIPLLLSIIGFIWGIISTAPPVFGILTKS